MKLDGSVEDVKIHSIRVPFCAGNRANFTDEVSPRNRANSRFSRTERDTESLRSKVTSREVRPENSHLLNKLSSGRKKQPRTESIFALADLVEM